MENKSYCVISPYSKNLRNGTRNAKNYAYWDIIVQYIHKKKLAVLQVGGVGENPIVGVGEFPGDQVILGKSFKELEVLVKNSFKWLSVDNFFHHFCASINVPGIVIFSKSDPLIFGHSINTNLLKSRSFLRSDQFGIWENVEYDMDAFIDPDAVAKHIN